MPLQSWLQTRSAEQAAQAIFLRCLSQYYYLNLFGQVPYRTVAKYNGIDASGVMTPQQALDTIILNLQSIIPALNYTGTPGQTVAAPYKASPDAARFLLMKALLNKQAFLNRQVSGSSGSRRYATGGHSWPGHHCHRKIYAHAALL